MPMDVAKPPIGRMPSWFACTKISLCDYMYGMYCTLGYIYYRKSRTFELLAFDE
jgi:hypothetical protein